MSDPGIGLAFEARMPYLIVPCIVLVIAGGFSFKLPVRWLRRAARTAHLAVRDEPPR